MRKYHVTVKTESGESRYSAIAASSADAILDAHDLFWPLVPRVVSVMMWDKA